MPHNFAFQTDFLTKLRDSAHRLPRAERIVARAILEEPRTALTLSISEMAERTGVAEATIVRMSRRFGLSGYQELKLLVAADRSESDTGVSAWASAGGSAESEIERIVAASLASLKATQEMVETETVQRLAEALDSARLVSMFGVGTSALAARYLSYRLVRMGIPSAFEEDTHYQLMGTVLLGEQTVAVAFSQSGSTYSVKGALRAAQSAGAFTAAVTRVRAAPLTAHAMVTLLTGADETPFLSGALPGLVAQLYIADVVAVATGRRRPERAQDVLRLSAQRVAELKF